MMRLAFAALAASMTFPAAPVLADERSCPPGWHRISIDAMGSDGRIARSITHCEPPPDFLVGEKFTGRVLRVETERDASSPSPLYTRFKVKVELEVLAVQKGSAKVGQTLLLNGYRTTSNDGRIDGGSIYVRPNVGDRLQVRLRTLQPPLEPPPDAPLEILPPDRAP